MFLNFSDALTRKKLQDRFQFLAQRFYKFKAAKPKKGTKDVGVEFKCVQCGKDIHCSTASYSNLRRHINLKHSCIINEYDSLWAKNIRKRGYEDESEGPSTSQKQSKIGNFFGGPKVLASQESAVATQENLDEAIVEFVVCCNQPYAIVEKPEFRTLVLLGKQTRNELELT